MKIIRNTIVVLLVFLGISAGVVKVMQMPDDMEFFMGAGFSATDVVIFGIAHILGGALLIFQMTRFWGAIIIAICFGISTVLVFMAGQTGFGIVSTVSVLLALFVVVDCHKTNSADPVFR